MKDMLLAYYERIAFDAIFDICRQFRPSHLLVTIIFMHRGLTALALDEKAIDSAELALHASSFSY
jgi:hypothetical protein